MTDNHLSIKLDPVTQAFYKGVKAGSEVADDLAGAQTQASYDERTRFFWLSVGTKLASSGLDGNDTDGVASFVRGAASRAPEPQGVHIALETEEPMDVDDNFTRVRLAEHIIKMAGRIRSGIAYGSLGDGVTFKSAGLY